MLTLYKSSFIKRISSFIMKKNSEVMSYRFVSSCCRVHRKSESHVLEPFQSLVRKGEDFDIFKEEMEHLKGDLENSRDEVHLLKNKLETKRDIIEDMEIELNEFEIKSKDAKS